MKFIIDSDLHFRSTGSVRAEKRKSIDLIQQQVPDCVIVIGDLCDTGADGTWTCENSKKCCYVTEDEFGCFMREFMMKVPAPTKVLLCPGNHDTYSSGIWESVKWWLGITKYRYRVLNFITARHGDVFYSWLQQDLLFVCLGAYPQQLAFLRKELEKQKKTLLFWHYNLMGVMSDWWTHEEKQAFLQTIEPFRENIVALCVGHRHESYNEDWNGFRVLSGAGSRPLVCTWENNQLIVN